MNERREREIEVKVLFADVLKKWRQIIIITILCGLLGMSFYALKKLPTDNINNEKYAMQLQGYEGTKATVEQQYADTQNRVAILSDYIQKSVKASINPYNEARSSETIAISINNISTDISATLENTNKVKAVTNAYISYISSIDYSSLVATLSVDAKYIGELVTVEGNPDTGLTTVSAIGTNKDQTATVLEFVMNQIRSNEMSLQAQYGFYTVNYGTLLTQFVVDQTLMTSFDEKSLSENLAMNNAKTAINSLQATGAKQQAALTSLKMPEKPTTVVSNNLIKYFVFGIVGGFVGVLILLGIFVILDGMILSEKELENLFDLRCFGVLPMKNLQKKPNKIDQSILKMMDSAFGEDKNTALQKIVANIDAYDDIPKSIVLISIGISQNITDIQTELQAFESNTQFNSSSNIHQNVDELNKLKHADAVIIVAERNHTKLNKLANTIELINDWKKPLIGSIVL